MVLVFVMVQAIACGTSSDTPPSRLPPGSLGAGFVDLNAFPDDDPAFALLPQVNLASDNESSVGCLGDLDGDGRIEIVSGRGQVVARTYDPIHKQLGEERVLSVSGPFFPSVMGVVDLDGDGATDLISGEGLRVAWGRPGSFDAGPVDLLLPDSAGSLAFADLDSDGWLDLVSGGESTVPFQRVGLRAWRPRPDWMPDVKMNYPYSLIVTQLHPDEWFIAGLGGARGQHEAPWPAGFYRQVSAPLSSEPRFVDFDPTPADAFYRYRPEFTSLVSANPMGGAVADIDGDGQLDLMVSTSPIHAFFLGTGAWPLRDRTLDVHLDGLIPDQNKYPMIAWGAALIEVDGDGHQDLLTAHGNDSGYVGRLGPQRITLHLGQGGIRFADGSEAARLTLDAQWHSLTLGDLDNDGDVDIVSGRLDLPPRLFRNDIDGRGHRLSLKLHGTTSNHLGVGARLWVQTTPADAERLVIADGVGAPESVTDPIAFIGLGAASLAHRIRIEWPSGYVQELHDVPAGQRHDITEPQLLRVEPVGRHAPADGTQTMEVIITPRDAAGNVRRDAQVSVQLEGSDAPMQTLQPLSEGALRVRLGPVSTKGETVVRVSIDGTEVRVHPRLWWD